MPRRIAAIALATAGIWSLASLGWALLVLGVLVEIGWPRDRSEWLETARRRALEVWPKIRAMPQQLTGASAVIAGVAVLPTGAGLVTGRLGAALLVLGALLLWLGITLDKAA
jgi:hypothetical protein